ncbi:hypothetical protein D3C80_1442530 [compost metagenome]
MPAAERADGTAQQFRFRVRLHLHPDETTLPVIKGIDARFHAQGSNQPVAFARRDRDFPERFGILPGIGRDIPHLPP